MIKIIEIYIYLSVLKVFNKKKMKKFFWKLFYQAYKETVKQLE